MPVVDWLESLDASIRQRIKSRLARVTLGNLGEYKVLGEGISELKFAFGSGYRIYFSEIDEVIVLLLSGGDKKTQRKNIKLAKVYLSDYIREVKAMGKSIKYHDYLIESLKDPEEAAGYLNAALDDGDIDGFLEALRNVVEAYGGMTQLAQKTSKSRNSLYKTVARTGNPYLRNTNELLHALGFHLMVKPDVEVGKRL